MKKKKEKHTDGQQTRAKKSEEEQKRAIQLEQMSTRAFSRRRRCGCFLGEFENFRPQG